MSQSTTPPLKEPQAATGPPHLGVGVPEKVCAGGERPPGQPSLHCRGPHPSSPSSSKCSPPGSETRAHQSLQPLLLQNAPCTVAPPGSRGASLQIWGATGGLWRPPWARPCCAGRSLQMLPTKGEWLTPEALMRTGSLGAGTPSGQKGLEGAGLPHREGDPDAQPRCPCPIT